MGTHEGFLDVLHYRDWIDFNYCTCVVLQWPFFQKEPGSTVWLRTWSPRTRELYWFRRSTRILKVQEQNKNIYLLDLWVFMFSHFVRCIFSPTVLNKIQACKIHDKWFDVFILWLISHMVTEVIILLMSSVSICHGCNSNWLLASDHIIKQRGNNALQGSLTVRMFILFHFFFFLFQGYSQRDKIPIKEIKENPFSLKRLIDGVMSVCPPCEITYLSHTAQLCLAFLLNSHNFGNLNKW